MAGVSLLRLVIGQGTRERESEFCCHAGAFYVTGVSLSTLVRFLPSLGEPPSLPGPGAHTARAGAMSRGTRESREFGVAEITLSVGTKKLVSLRMTGRFNLHSEKSPGDNGSVAR